MMGKKRFYCPKCKRFMDRRAVEGDEWEQIYFCKKCDEVVLRTEKIETAMLKDFAEYAIMKDKADELI